MGPVRHRGDAIHCGRRVVGQRRLSCTTSCGLSVPAAIVSVPPLDVNTMRWADLQGRDVDGVVASRALNPDRIEVSGLVPVKSPMTWTLSPPPALPGVGVVVTVVVLTRISSMSLSSAMTFPLPVPFRVMTISVAAARTAAGLIARNAALV